ncbi:MAG: hypothetical protein QGI60_04170 [archaeon]|jgi:hypothetical protein|nr:hypothetical protein [archaeon]
MHPGKHSAHTKATKVTNATKTAAAGAAKPPVKDFAHMDRAIQNAISLSKVGRGGQVNWGVIQAMATKANVSPRALAAKLVQAGYKVLEIMKKNPQSPGKAKK